MPLGRRDGTISLASEVIANIPAPTFNFSQLKQNFASKGLDILDLVVLSGNYNILLTPQLNPSPHPKPPSTLYIEPIQLQGLGYQPLTFVSNHSYTLKYFT